MKFIKFDGREFKVGMKIKLGGQLGTIHYISTTSHYQDIKWETTIIDAINLKNFPDLEIGIEEPTISEDLKDYLLDWADRCDDIDCKSFSALITKLASMVKKD